MLSVQTATSERRVAKPRSNLAPGAEPVSSAVPALIVGRGVLRSRTGGRKAAWLVSLGVHGAVAAAWLFLVLPGQEAPKRSLMMEFPPEVALEETMDPPPPPSPAVEEPIPDPEPPEEFPPEDVSSPVELPAGAFADDDGLRDAFATGLGSGVHRRRTGRGPGTADGSGESVAPPSPAPIPVAPRSYGPTRGASILLDLCEEPDYPMQARSRGWEGRVVVLVDIDANGSVTGAELAASCGHTVLDEAALEAVLQWRFEPALRDGVAVTDQLRIPIRFRLKRSE